MLFCTCVVLCGLPSDPCLLASTNNMWCTFKCQTRKKKKELIVVWRLVDTKKMTVKCDYETEGQAHARW